MGQEKRALSGFSSKATVLHAGLMLQSEVVQLAPPYLRPKALRVTAAKVCQWFGGMFRRGGREVRDTFMSLLVWVSFFLSGASFFDTEKGSKFVRKGRYYSVPGVRSTTLALGVRLRLVCDAFRRGVLALSVANHIRVQTSFSLT